MTPGRTGVVLVAAGTGDRLGAGGPKALVEVAGRTLLAHALDVLEAAGVDPPVVVHTPGAYDAFVSALAGREVRALVAGGATRTDSVRAGVAALDDTFEVVAIHDAARALTPPEVIRRCLDALVDDVVAVAPALPVADTLKRVEASEVTATVDRAGLVGVQTPQVFPRRVLLAALADADTATDDLALVEQAIADGRVTGRVVVVAGSVLGAKITYPDDLAVAEALVRARSSHTPRIGSGIDVHPFGDDDGRSLVIAGVEVPGSPGLAGHSDADVAAHAIADALLGAAALGDLGTRFGVDDPRTAGADSMGLLAAVVHDIAHAGFVVGNLDVTVVAQRPRLAPHRAAMRARLAEVLTVDLDQVSVKFTTTDRLGTVGRGEGIAAWASCLLLPLRR